MPLEELHYAEDGDYFHKENGGSVLPSNPGFSKQSGDTSKINCDICNRPCKNKCRVHLRFDVPTFYPCCKRWKPCSLLAEFLGTFILIFVGCMCVLTVGHTDLSASIAHGFVLFALIAAFGPISGAHFSPFVSLATAVMADLAWIALPLYWLAQFLGALAGAAMVLIFFSSGTGLGTPVPVAPFSFTDALILEIFGSFVFILLLLFLQKARINVSWALGALFVALEIIGLPISGGAYNFWRYLAPAIFAGIWSPIWVYLVGEFVGMILAVLVFWLYCWLCKYSDRRLFC